MTKPIINDKASILNAVLTSDPQDDWSSSKRPIDVEIGDPEVRYFNGNVNLRFEPVFDDIFINGKDFKEPWTAHYPDQNTSRIDFIVYYGATPIYNFSLVSVDGHKALLPMPKPGTRTVSALHHKLAEIYMRDSLPVLANCMQISGLSV